LVVVAAASGCSPAQRAQPDASIVGTVLDTNPEVRALFPDPPGHGCDPEGRPLDAEIIYWCDPDLVRVEVVKDEPEDGSICLTLLTDSTEGLADGCYPHGSSGPPPVDAGSCALVSNDGRAVWILARVACPGSI